MQRQRFELLYFRFASDRIPNTSWSTQAPSGSLSQPNFGPPIEAYWTMKIRESSISPTESQGIGAVPHSCPKRLESGHEAMRVREGGTVT
jgi:hypothetical protein